MNKILIFYGSYGGGHLSAAKNIKAEIENNYPNCEIMLVDCIEYVNKVLNKVSTKIYTSVSKNARWMWKRIYHSSDTGPLSKISNSMNKIMAIKLNKLIQDFNPSLIISTHPFSSQMCAILKKKQKINCKLATVMTDYISHNQWLVAHEFVDYFFVAHEGMIEELSSQGVNKNKVFACGIPLSNKFLEKYDKIKIFKEYELNPLKKTILFFAGGEFGLGKEKTFSRLKCIIENFNNVQVIAIAGKNEKMKKHFEDIVAQTNTSSSVKILGFTSQVPELMSICDIVITKPGGLTTTESLASGLALLIIDPLPCQEEANAMFVEKNGAGIWIREEMDLKEAISDILNSPNKLENMRNNSRLVSKKNSTRDICKILLG